MHNPNGRKLGNMDLPNIHESFRSNLSNIVIRIGGDKSKGVLLQSNNSDIYLEVESPANSHIMMKEKEIHMGIRLNDLSGTLNESWQYDVPHSELRSTTNEQNPLTITYAHMKLTFSKEIFKGAIEAINKVID
ncbi:hypothetical protein NQU59_00395 [Acinetobacter colistiniresistens]|uniref:hypothetical protein n=1 Tax=Acinetobacter colistiniresistens TaxID=280145 RepID=UPI00211C997C|nr:hypothetical protein [Acinetobacter colistiniresistens]UUM27658.1 hypothetical protein NQU59_00395 [Acinetobacter colistiniresistens]